MNSKLPDENDIAERISHIREAFATERSSAAPPQETADAAFNDFINFVRWEPFNNFNDSNA